MRMRFNPIAVIPLFLAAVALVIASKAGGYSLLLTAVLAAVAVFISLVTIFRYGRPSVEVKQPPVENFQYAKPSVDVKQPPVENFRYAKPSIDVKQVSIEDFSLWVDVEGPGSELRRLSPDDLEAAMRITNADLSSLSSNADLLNARISLLLGRPEFVELTQEKFDEQTGCLSQDLRIALKKLGTGKELSAEVLNLIERCASQADRIANKLYDFQRGKPELVQIYTEPLRRAAEKLSRDMRLVFTNVSDFVKSTSTESQSS